MDWDNSTIELIFLHPLVALQFVLYEILCVPTQEDWHWCVVFLGHAPKHVSLYQNSEGGDQEVSKVCKVN
jgi:hypothetical protein